MKRAKIGVSCQHLLALLNVPKNAGITGIEYDTKHNCIYVYLNNVGEELPECAVAQMTSIEDL